MYTSISAAVSQKKKKSISAAILKCLVTESAEYHCTQHLRLGLASGGGVARLWPDGVRDFTNLIWVFN